MRNHPGHAGQAAQQPLQGCLHFQHHPHAAPGGQGGIAAELQRVAESLLGVNQQGLSRRRLATPLRLGECAASCRHLAGVPAVFVFLPPSLQIAPREQRHRQMEPHLPEIRPQDQGAAIPGDRLLQPSLVAQHVGQIVVDFRQVRPQGDGGAAAGFRLGPRALVAQHDAQIAMGVG